MTETPAIETEGLTKRFGKFTAVADLDLRVETGTVVSLLGPNGAGKTTTVRMLATLLRPDAGSARVGGHDVVHESAQVWRLIALTGQFAALDPNLTARENLVLMACLRGRGRRDAAEVTARLIERFAIGEFRDRLVRSFRAASAGGSTSRPVRSTRRTCSCSTSRPPVSIPAAARSSGRRSAHSWTRA